MTMATTTPSIVPDRSQSDGTIYIVLQDFGALGCAYRETDPEHADRDSVINDLIRGEFDRPLQVVAINIAEGWAKDVSSDIAIEIRTRSRRDGCSLVAGAQHFLEHSVVRATL